MSKLTQEQKRVLLAEAAGVKPVLVEWWATNTAEDSICLSCETKAQVEKWLSDLSEGSPYKNYHAKPFYRYPDYFGSLDAVHGLCSVLTDQQHDRFNHKLEKRCSDDFYEEGNLKHWSPSAIHATAEQRAETIGQVLALWKDGE